MASYFYLQVHVEKAVISTHELTQPRSPKKEILLLEDSYFKGPGTVSDNTYDGSIMLYNDSCSSRDLEDRLQVCVFGSRDH